MSTSTTSSRKQTGYLAVAADSPGEWGAVRQAEPPTDSTSSALPPIPGEDSRSDTSCTSVQPDHHCQLRRTRPRAKHRVQVFDQNGMSLDITEPRSPTCGRRCLSTGCM